LLPVRLTLLTKEEEIKTAFGRKGRINRAIVLMNDDGRDIFDVLNTELDLGARISYGRSIMVPLSATSALHDAPNSLNYLYLEFHDVSPVFYN